MLSEMCGQKEELKDMEERVESLMNLAVIKEE